MFSAPQSLQGCGSIFFWKSSLLCKKSINQEYEIRYTIPEIHKSNSEYSATRRQDSNIIKNFTFVLIKSYSLLFPVKFFSQGKPCFHYRDPCNENRVLCNENRFFPVRKTSQGKLCFHYRDGFAVHKSDFFQGYTLIWLRIR